MSKVLSIAVIVICFIILGLATQSTEAFFHKIIKNNNNNNNLKNKNKATYSYSALALWQQMQAGLLNMDNALISSIIADNAQILMPSFGDTLVNKSYFLNNLQQAFAQTSQFSSKWMVQTVSDTSLTARWELDWVLQPQFMNGTYGPWSYDSIRSVQLRTNTEGSQITYFASITNGAERPVNNASQIIATTVSFLNAMQTLDVPKIMSYMSPQVTMTFYPATAAPSGLPRICDYSCIANLMNKNVAMIVDKKLDIFSNAATDGFVNFDLHAFTRKNYFYINDPHDASKIIGLIETVSEVLQYDSNLKIVHYDAYVNSE